MGINVLKYTVTMRYKVLAALIAVIMLVTFAMIFLKVWGDAELKEAADQFLGHAIVLDGKCLTITDHSQDCRTWTLSNGATISWDLLKTMKKYDGPCTDERKNLD
jgi:hypothetical protein